MPNHIHGILVLQNGFPPPDYFEIFDYNSLGFDNIGDDRTGRVIGSYKSSVTKHANRLNLENGWQTLFHDNIIRSKEDYFRIKKYIRNNPKYWKDDRFY